VAEGVVRDRVNSCYQVDHGGGRYSLKLVVGRDKGVWIVASIRYDEATLRYWDSMDRNLEGNVRRLTW